MAQKRNYVAILASAVFGAVIMFVFVRYNDFFLLFAIVLSALSGATVAVYSSMHDVLFRDEAISILKSLRTEIQTHTKEDHKVSPFTETEEE